MRWLVVVSDDRGGRAFDVEAGEQSMGSELNVLGEPEAAALVAKQPPDAAASCITNLGPTASSLLLDNDSAPPALQLQQPPFKLKAANRGRQSKFATIRYDTRCHFNVRSMNVSSITTVYDSTVKCFAQLP